jgi:hypothetical protein
VSRREEERRLLRAMARGDGWVPLQKCEEPVPLSDDVLDAMMKHEKNDLSREELRQKVEAYNAEGEVWINDIYQVQVRRSPEEGSAHINIRRRDGAAILRDWRHFQRIKNEVIGEECEAVELYPAESRKVDASNKYHLYASLDPTFRFPFGMPERDVSDASGSRPGLRQRPGAESTRAKMSKS